MIEVKYFSMASTVVACRATERVAPELKRTSSRVASGLLLVLAMALVNILVRPFSPDPPSYIPD
jgi:predicted Kef-type K+ transport protein